MAALEKQFAENIGKLTESEKNIIEKQIQTINLQIGYILPDDTMAFICRWAAGNDVSDIKKLTKDNLLRTASLAKLHNKAPSDYISGVYTDYNKIEIDTYATQILQEFMRNQEIVREAKQSKYRWFMGGRKGMDNNSILPSRSG